MQESGLRIAIKSYQLSEDMLIIPLSKEDCNSLGITLRDLLKSEFTISCNNDELTLRASLAKDKTLKSYTSDVEGANT